jgi:hypothetical protein
MRLASVILAVLLTSAEWTGAPAQSLERTFQDMDRLGQPTRAALGQSGRKSRPVRSFVSTTGLGAAAGPSTF